MRKHRRLFLHLLPSIIKSNIMKSNGLNRNAANLRPAAYSLTSDIKDQIKKIAALLPPMCEEYDTITEVPGLELQNRGIFEVKQHGLIKPVEIAETYDVPGVALKDINHILKLRKFYHSGGILGIHQYLIKLSDYEAEMRAKYPSLWQSGTYIGVKDGTLLLPDAEYTAKVEAIKQMNIHIQNQ